MTGRFNQDLPENLQTAFEKATNFKSRIITKQNINNRKVHEINHVDVTQGDDKIETRITRVGIMIPTTSKTGRRRITTH